MEQHRRIHRYRWCAAGEDRLMELEHRGPVPVYVQCADEIERRIRDGVYPPGRPILSEVAMHQEWGIARATARRVVRELRERGLVFTVPMRGTYVVDSIPSD